MNGHLYRSRTNRMVAGVCGGIAEYFRIDPTIVRLIWVLFSLTYGIGVMVYIIMAIVVPEGDASYVYQDNRGQNKIEDPRKLSVIFGSILIVIGAAMIAKRYFNIDWLDARLFWPIVLIAVGILVIYGGFKNK